MLRGFKANSALLWLGLFLSLPLTAVAQEIGTVTLVDGSLRVIRGTTVLKGAEGMRLHQGDILESSNPGFVQLEFSGGAIVALGNSTRLFLLRYTAGRGVGDKAAAELVLLSGWLKGEDHSKLGASHYDSILLAATTRNGTLVLHATPQAAEMFVESGSASVGEVSSDGNLRSPASAKAGQFYTRPAGKIVQVSSHPSPTFIESMPAPFRDTFPSRLSRFAGKHVEPKRDHEVAYSEVHDWLTVGQRWRKGFAQRFEPRLKDAAFRKALAAHLNEHPEWGPILHPEKYESKAPPEAGSSPNSQ
jgi:hypothetical protein